MDGYILKSQAVAALSKYGLSNGSALGHHSGAVECAIAEIEAIKPVGAVPVVHGRWEIVRRMADGAICECSVCGRQERFDSFHRHDNCPYCHCGAKMDFDNKNQEEKL